MRSRSCMGLMNAMAARLFERKARYRSRSPRWRSKTLTLVATTTTSSVMAGTPPTAHARQHTRYLHRIKSATPGHSTRSGPFSASWLRYIPAALTEGSSSASRIA